VLETGSKFRHGGAERFEKRPRACYLDSSGSSGCLANCTSQALERSSLHVCAQQAAEDARGCRRGKLCGAVFQFGHPCGDRHGCLFAEAPRQRVQLGCMLLAFGRQGGGMFLLQPFGQRDLGARNFRGYDLGHVGCRLSRCEVVRGHVARATHRRHVGRALRACAEVLQKFEEGDCRHQPATS